MFTVEKVPSCYIPVVESKFNAIFNRAAKKGLEGNLAYSFSGEYCEMPKKDKEPFRGTFVDVNIFGAVPKIDGWALVARITIEDSHVATMVVPGKELPKKYRKSVGECDHCTHKRRRKDTFVIEKDGEFMEIGRNCMKDFFPTKNPVAMVEFLKFVDEMRSFNEDDYMGTRMKVEYTYNIVDVVAMSAAVIDEDGWVSKSAAMEDEELCPTAPEIASQLMMYYGYRRPHVHRGEAERTIVPANKHFALAEKVVEFVRNEMRGSNDYVYNMKGFFRLDEVKHKYISFVASAVSAYNRHVQKVAVRKFEKKPGTTGDFVGAIGDKIEVAVEIIGTQVVNSYYGSNNLVRMVDADDNLYTTFNNGDFGYDAEVGQKMTIKGAIKKHQEYRGSKQNMLTRVKKAK